MSMPAPIVINHAGFHVVRDDLLAGGTKRRVIQPMIESSRFNEFVYASPAYGYAQLALAYACAAAGKKSTIFTAKRGVPHRLTMAAKHAGAKVVMVPHGYLSNVQSKAKLYASLVGANYVPFGVDTPESIQSIAQAARLISFEPSEVWTVAGSGTLTRGLQAAWPNATFYAVVIGKRDADIGRAKRLVAPEKFEQDARLPPPWPSCANYDAKLWQFAKQHAKKGALIWNVGS